MESSRHVHLLLQAFTIHSEKLFIESIHRTRENLTFFLWGENVIEKPYIVISVESFLDGIMMFLKPTDIPPMPNVEHLPHSVEEQTA